VDQIHHVVAKIPPSFFADGRLTVRFTTKNVSSLNYESSGVDNLKITAFYECAPCVDVVVVVEEDFEDYTSDADVVNSGWINGKLEDANTPFTNFLGRYDQNSDTAADDPYKSYDVPPGADYLMVELDFYEIDSWDGEDCIYVYLNDQELELLLFNFNVDEGYKSGVSTNGIVWVIDSKPNPPAQIGFNAAEDQIHHLRARVPSYLFVSGVLTMRLATRLNSDKNDESAGYDNIKITAHYNCDNVCLPTEVVSFEDFEDSSSSLAGWVNGKLAFDTGFTQFLGQYDSSDEDSSEDPVKYYFVPKDATYLTVEFDFYEIDNWADPDCIYVYIAAQTLGLGFFTEGADDGGKTGTAGTITWTSESQGPPAHIGFSSSHKDQIHHVTATVPPPNFDDGLLRLSFGTRVEGSGKSAGYDNIKITVHRDCGSRVLLQPPQEAIVAKEEETLKEETLKEGAVNTDCEEDSEGEDLRRVDVDKCIAPDRFDPIEILSQDTDTVTFSVTQVWKGCDFGSFFQSRKLSWLATDYVASDGELTCSKFNGLECGEKTTLTAVCQDGETIVDLFTYDGDGRVFGQSDDAPIVIPMACGGDDGDATKMCHYRYVVKCAPRKCGKTVEPRKVKKDSFSLF